MKLKLNAIILILFTVSVFGQTRYTGIFNNPANNDQHNHFVRNDDHLAVIYVNQVGAGPLMVLSNETAVAGENPKFVVENNGSVGIGSDKPQADLHISRSGQEGTASILIESDRDNTNSSAASLLSFKRSGTINFEMGISKSFFGEGHFGIRSFVNDSVHNDLLNIDPINGYVGIGTTTPNAVLSVNGILHAKEIKIDLDGWSDYVFEDEYFLLPLQELEKYISENHHLPDIPSEEKVLKEGIEVGDISKKLLAKIEELVLYTINQENEIISLEFKAEKILLLENKIEELERLIEKH